jgi:hypothetical protein
MHRYFTFTNYYPRALEKRPSLHNPTTRVARKALLRAAAINFVLLQILFLSLFAYLFGTLYVQRTHTHNLDVVFVDYDGGLLGDTIRDAYKSLQGKGFPTLIERQPSEFPTQDDLRNEVCKTHYWAAIYTSPGASHTLQDVLASPRQYDKSGLLTYVWNEARFPTVVDSAISGSMQTLSSTARVAFASSNLTATVTPGSGAFSVFADPWHLSSINIQPTTQGPRLVYNTIVIILLLMQEFFYIGIINSLSEAFKIYTRLSPHLIIIFRTLMSGTYCLIGALCISGMIWAFDDHWNVSGGQFVLTWMAFWLFAHNNFLILDSFTVWLPPPFVPMALITWAVLNVSSILLPFGLTPGFYHWGYSLPAHNVYDLLIDIWSGGCNPKLHYALPILFSWELCGLFFSALGVYKRSHLSTIKAEAEVQAFQKRIDDVLSFEHKRDEEHRKEEEGTTAGDILPTKKEEEEDREDLERVIGQEDKKEQEARSPFEKDKDFGPAFGFDFGCDDPEKRK